MSAVTLTLMREILDDVLCEETPRDSNELGALAWIRLAEIVAKDAGNPLEAAGPRTRRRAALVEASVEASEDKMNIERARRAASKARLDLDVDTFVRAVKALPVFRDCPRSIKRTKVVLVHLKPSG